MFRLRRRALFGSAGEGGVGDLGFLRCDFVFGEVGADGLRRVKLGLFDNDGRGGGEDGVDARLELDIGPILPLPL